MANRITPAQIRGARGMLDWSMVQLAAAAGLSVSTIKRVEMAAGQLVSDEAHSMVQAAFEAEGVRFLDDTGEGCGLRQQTADTPLQGRMSNGEQVRRVAALAVGKATRVRTQSAPEGEDGCEGNG